jgi:predicted transglutaminase-like cysteine proteinase
MMKRSFLGAMPVHQHRLQSWALKAWRTVFRAVLGLGFVCLTTIGPWAALTFDVLRNTAMVQHGEATLKVIDQWIALIKKIEPLSDQEKLQYTNNFFNSAVSWITDQDNWQQEDYWATPLETLARRKGDCEDFSISKYITLVLSGMPEEKLRITYVKARITENGVARNQAHMVLAYYPKPMSEPLILDNIARDIVRGSLRRDLTPVFGFNTGVITVGHGTKPSNEKPTNRLSRWGDALAKMKQEGICLPGEACS